MHRCSLDAPSTRATTRPALFLLAGLALLPAVFPAHAARVRHLDWRQTQQIVKLESMAVDDVPGHVISLGESHGRAIFKNGEIARVTYKYLADYTLGTGPFWGYGTLIFKDQSRIYTKSRMHTAVGPDGRTTTFKGLFIFIRGTGRFRGIRGGGTCTGHRSVRHARRAWLELDHISTYRLARH
jgi:hypothetical protein